MSALGLALACAALPSLVLAAAPPNPPPADPELGTGPQGTGIVLPVCPPGSSYNIDAAGNSTGQCEPLQSPAPPGTTLLGNPGACTVPVGVELDGFFTAPDQMDEFFECWIPELEAWVSEEYGGVANNPIPNGYVYVPTGVAKDNLIGGCELKPDEDIYFFCGLDSRIYLGEATAWAIYRQLGDLVAVVGLAHELGHHLQQASGVPRSHPDRVTEQIPYENQSDCVAGVFIDYVNSRGGLTSGDADVEDDLVDLAQGMEALQSFESQGDARDHGTMDQRLRSFYTGYLGNEGLNACNVFITDFTVLPTTGIQITAPTIPPDVGPTPTVPLPAPTLDPAALGTDPGLNSLAQRCFDGDMSACDDLFESARGLAGADAYATFADTCAGRQPANTGTWCSDAFPAAGPAPGVTAPTAPGITAPGVTAPGITAPGITAPTAPAGMAKP